MLVNRNQLIKTVQTAYPFNLTTASEIDQLVERSDVVFFKTGSLVYLEGAAANYIYLIYEGVVEIFIEDNQELIKLNLLKAGFVFGEDVFFEKQNRRSGARVESDTILVRIEKEVIHQISIKNRDINQALEIMMNGYEVLIEKNRHQLFEDETIIFLGRPHRFHFIFRNVVLSFFFLIVGLIGFFLFTKLAFSFSILIWFYSCLALIIIWNGIWSYLEWRNDHFIFTNKRIISLDRVLLFRDLRYETPLNAIINLNIRKNFLGGNLNFGDLFVKTYTGVSKLKNVPKVESVAKLLEFVWKKERISSRKEENLIFERMLNDHSEMDDGVTLLDRTDLDQNNSRQEAGHLSLSLNNLLKPRIAQNDEVIYYPHWIMLIIKGFFPASIMASIVLINIFMAVNNFGIQSNIVYQMTNLIAFVICFFWWLYQYFDWRRDQYIITPEQIMDVDRKPFGIEDLRTAPIKNIQSIRYKRKGILGLLLNFGTVFIRVGDDELTFDNVFDPAAVQQELFRKLEHYLSNQKRANLSEQQRHLADWISSYLEKENTPNDEKGNN